MRRGGSNWLKPFVPCLGQLVGSRIWVYFARVNFRCGVTCCGVLLSLLAAGADSALAAGKEIRLRNERILPQAGGRPSPTAELVKDEPVSGTHLIQFSSRFDPAWRQELSRRNVQLLRYVPEDTFLVRLRGARIEELRALPFVRWVGRYRPDHKIHNSLRPGLARAMNDRPAVSVLMAPLAGPDEIAEVRGRFSRIEQESHLRFGPVLRGTLAPGQLQRLAESDSVLWIEPAPQMRLFDEASSQVVAGAGTNRSSHSLALGFNGRGVTVAVADTGLHRGTVAGMHPDLAGRVTFLPPYGGLTNSADEHGHGTHVAGIIAGNGAAGAVDNQGRWYGLGVATGATIVVQRIFDGNGRYVPPPSFAQLTSEAVGAGAMIGNNSWGDNAQGRYDVSAYEFDALVRDADPSAPGDQPYIMEFSAGNAGPGAQTISSPAVAKNVIASGAGQGPRSEFFTYSDGVGVIADFSSRGPCEDGRIKPDVVAPGTWVASLRSPLSNPLNASQLIDDNYQYMGGTSQSGPHVSGAAAAFVQYYREILPDAGIPSPALVKAALIHSAVEMNPADADSAPNASEGWGRVDLTQIIFTYLRTQEYLDQTQRLATGQMYQRRLVVENDTAPLKITLAYTDVPGLPAAIPALVNDLDLELVAPDGRKYRGNQFDHGESVPDAPTGDSVNNVEGILLRNPAPGEYFVRVLARNVVEDAVVATPEEADQDFALVMSGNIPASERGVVVLDRSSYTAPGQIRIKLFDLDLDAVQAAAVTVRSSVETAGQTLFLSNAAPGGVFTGTILTAQGNAAADGKLQIAHGGLIRVEYYDDSENELRVAEARGDLVAPLITGVAVTNQFGRMVVSWMTDEPADSVVRYGTTFAGTNLVVSGTVSNGLRTTMHRLELAGLVANTTYYFSVSSTDAAGNTRIGKDGGSYFQFLAVPSAAVLLVNAYLPDMGDPSIPLTSYTDALDQTGVTYDVWDGSSQLPLLDDLRSYQIVIWRINDSFNRSDDFIPPAQQLALQQYLNAGGAFFMSSMEILSRMRVHGGTEFMTNVLRVQRFEPNTSPDPFVTCTNCDEDFRVPAARGLDGDFIGDGFLVTLDYSNYPLLIEDPPVGPDFGDTFGPATNAAPFLVESVSGKACAMHFPKTGHASPGRVVFASFPFDAIPDNGLVPNNRASFLRRVLQFLAPGLNGVGSVAFDQASYQLPDLVAIEIADSDLAGLGAIELPVSSTTTATPVMVLARETARPGVFRGVVSLVTNGVSAGSGQISAVHGDFLYADYFDDSGQSLVQARARVDAVKPAISNLAVKPDWQDALVTWTTSEPADALVQFGESTFLGRTAYAGNLVTNHQVQLTGLVPNRTYYFRIISRDAAGNDREMDNGGLFFKFQTLPPLAPPFLDSMESSVSETNWSVVTDSTSQFSWQVGTPNNNIVSSGHESSRAWASRLLADAVSTIDTRLIGPSIDLSGGNVATLQFWHAYDFTKVVGADTEHWGRLFAVTNAVAAPLLLREYTGATTNWVFEEIDLSPFLGRVVSFIWHHKLTSISRITRKSWALDDVSITVSNLALGSIAISNNLALAQFELLGPSSRSGSGKSARFNNLIPGRYVTTWSNVPYYVAPVRQTNVLSENGSILFEGNYWFPDDNFNGMSDFWELDYFGDVSPVRDSAMDTDLDGSTDYSEFVAGTNPTNGAVYLRLGAPMLLPAQNRLFFQWQSAPGRVYGLEGLTRDFGTWVMLTNGIAVGGTNASATVPVPDDSEPNLFRLQVNQ